MTIKLRGRPKADPTRDLRQELLLTSRELLAEGGPGALSMREVARRAGCTHQAPYHYFKDREVILAALVVEGFTDLAERLQVANRLAGTEGIKATLVASAKAYVEFAISQPGVFQIMFRPDMCDATRFPDVQQAGASAYAELATLTQIVFGERASAALASILWAQVHGLGCLMIDGSMAAQFPTAQMRARHLQEVIEQFASMLVSTPTK
ncbi:MAG: TetR/AcrR family transcriptional regulator [Alcaligenaceae bacterium]